MTARSIAGTCPDCGQQFMTKQGLKGHVGTSRCPMFSHEDESPPACDPREHVGAGESNRWRRNRVMSTGQNFFVRR